MENYDNWKLSTPEDHKENECKYCGDECHDEYCSKECFNNNLND